MFIFYSNKWTYTAAGEIALLISQIFQKKKNTPKKRDIQTMPYGLPTAVLRNCQLSDKFSLSRPIEHSSRLGVM